MTIEEIANKENLKEIEGQTPAEFVKDKSFDELKKVADKKLDQARGLAIRCSHRWNPAYSRASDRLFKEQRVIYRYINSSEDETKADSSVGSNQN